jgi:hypothetical protein
MTYSGGLRRSLVPYTGAEKWGTGYNPIHEDYGSDPLRLEPYPVRRGEVVKPADAVPEAFVNPEEWGYTVEDSRATGVDYDGRPSWDEQPPEYRGDSDNHPSYNAPGFVNESFRGQKEGAHRYNQKDVDSEPSETVTEGWRNKPKGQPADSKPADDSQVFIKTSMVQRYKTRVNDAAVARGTDEPRQPIHSRVTGQKLKIYSEGERLYDMQPKEQNVIIRPFWMRTAGTGPLRYLLPNAYQPVDPIQRVPPPDPDLGPTETDLQEDYGYTPEDQNYAW